MGIQEQIIAAVTEGIASGRIPPETRLKGRAEYCRRFKTTPVTVQRAFNRLIKDGFVTSVKSSGTFVSQRPPCLYRYALVFPATPELPEWTRLQQSVMDHRETIEQEAGVALTCFLGMGLRADESENLRTLRTAHARQTLAGAVFLSELRNFHRDAWVGIDAPCYVIAQPGKSGGNPRIELGKTSFYASAADTFKTLGRKRIAIVANERYFREQEAVTKKVFAERNLAYHEELAQTFLISEACGVDRFIRLMFSLAPKQRPDGLFILDDNLFPQTEIALHRVGMEIGSDIDVVCHANFPVNETQPNVHRLGYNVPAAILLAIKNMRNGGTQEDIVVKPEMHKGR